MEATASHPLNPTTTIDSTPVGGLPGLGLHGGLRLPLLHLLLPLQDQDVGPTPDELLLRIHVRVFCVFLLFYLKQNSTSLGI